MGIHFFNESLVLKSKRHARNQGCIIRLVTLDALQCTENVVSKIDEN